MCPMNTFSLCLHFVVFWSHFKFRLSLVPCYSLCNFASQPIKDDVSVRCNCLVTSRSYDGLIHHLVPLGNESTNRLSDKAVIYGPHYCVGLTLTRLKYEFVNSKLQFYYQLLKYLNICKFKFCRKAFPVIIRVSRYVKTEIHLVLNQNELICKRGNFNLMSGLLKYFDVF